MLPGFLEASKQCQRIRNAILAPSWDTAREALQAGPDSPQEMHVLELYDTVRNMGKMGPELLFACVDKSLHDLGNSVPTPVVAALRQFIRTHILPWGVVPRVLEGDLSMNETNVEQLMDTYQWPFGSTRDHAQQLLVKIVHAMQGYRTVVQRAQPTEQERQVALESLHNTVEQALAKHGSRLLPGMAEDLLTRVHEFAQ